MPDIDGFVRVSDAGDVEHVAIVDGAHLVLARIEAGNVPALVENAQNRGDVAKAKSKGGNGISSKSTVEDLDAFAAEHEVADYPADGVKADKLAAIEAHNEGQKG